MAVLQIVIVSPLVDLVVKQVVPRPLLLLLRESVEMEFVELGKLVLIVKQIVDLAGTVIVEMEFVELEKLVKIVGMTAGKLV
jgi:hypothetical protein|tara:strand:+ start:428 stop:673 length:246 start_codon:yes stop_codon:yes gene_type:complete